MSHDPHGQLDVPLAHRRFSVDCFNHTWTLIEKTDRTPADTEAMVLCAMASLWHWTQRADCTNRNLSIGHWQVSRACALAGRGESAMHHARQSLALAEGLTPLYVGYAHEAVARAALLLNDREGFRSHLHEARACAARVADADERTMLEQDLRSLRSSTEAS